ncbi:MAG: GNAT family N-acetyltransferase [Candidatus Marinimicrobia bacterium]|nr:GNAT family N-acetyltransferase [Candidatus Neomarinimicrobiota bacterium]
MIPPPPQVLILHHQPGAAGLADEHSSAGVLDEVHAVQAALTRLGWPFRTVGIRRLAETAGALAAGPEEVVFNLVEELAEGPEAAAMIPAVAGALGKACTGNDTPALLLTLDKALTKACLRDQGLPVPEAVVFRANQFDASQVVNFPVIVKPLRADAGEGIDARGVIPAPGPALRSAVRRVQRAFGGAALVEQYIAGREFNLSVVALSGTPRVLPLAEIDFTDFPDQQPRIVDYAAKWQTESFAYQHTVRRLPANVSRSLAATLRQTARRAWQAAGCRDYIRLDLRVDAHHRPYILEINANPDIAPEAGFAAALAAAKIPYDEFVRSVVLAARQRQPAAAAVQTAAPPTDPAPTAPANQSLPIRPSMPADEAPIRTLLAATGFFRPDELAIAAEVLHDALTRPAAGYHSLTACDPNGRPLGWICFGQTPCTLGTWDIYWLAVDPAAQGQGLGRLLTRQAEAAIATAGGRLAVVETAGQPRYAPTRAFYERLGYTPAATLPDFYGPNDAKIIFLKRLVS